MKADLWTDEQEECLLEACKSTHRICDIALALEPVRHGITRNAVIGKIQRLRRQGHQITTGLPGGGYPGQNTRRKGRKVRKVVQPFVPPEIQAVSTLPKPRRGLPPPDTVQPEPNGETLTMRRLTLLELGPRTCRWPIGDVGEPGFFFCGNPTDPERVYCPVHHAVAHYRGNR
jgi:GcrA cell cycle regulator